MMIGLRSRHRSAPPHRSRGHNESIQATYNIIPVDHNLIVDNQSLNFPEVRAVATALRAVENIRIPPPFPWQPHHDLLDWLGAFFGFQVGNVSNQREHLVLLLANAQMRLQPPPENADTLDPSVLRHLRCKLLCNYTHWCSSVGHESNIWIFDSHSESSATKQRLELLYVALYLLIWGESANLRFIPGFICYVFHHMSMELNKIVENYIDENTGLIFSPSISGENAFLNRIVTPVYIMIKAELDHSRKETASHSNCPNYDEIDQYFWSRRCLDKLKWPIDIRSNFFSKRKRIWKMRFVVPKLQTLYSVYSSIVGMGVGLFNNLDEIQNMQQLRLKFQSLARAMKNNLMSEEHRLNARGTSKSKFKDAIHRFKLRYGFEKQFQNLELTEFEADKFTFVWNEIIWALREEDRVSDHEVELLTLADNDWNVRVVCWPCLFLCNELILALNQSMELVDVPDKRLWEEIVSNEYRRCAVIEAYDSVKHLLITIVKFNTPEHSILSNFFQEIDNSVNIEMFTKTYNMHVLPTIHIKLITLLDILIKPEKDVNKVANTLRELYEIGAREIFKDKRNMDQLLFKNAIDLPPLSDDYFYTHVRRLHTILTSRDAMNINVPINVEARHRLLSFCNSLLMNTRCAPPQVKKMKAFSVLTPYNDEEDVIYNKEQLRTENEDGVSMLLHNLKTIYSDEWQNFMERMWREGLSSEDALWKRNLRDLRLWASYRRQTLARNVRGTMHYNRALKLLAFLDFATEIDIREGLKEQIYMKYGGLEALTRYGTTSRVSSLLKVQEHIPPVQIKYTYVVACEMYKSQKSKKDLHADEILYLMKNNESLRVAYVDEVQARNGTEYYSVLVKYVQEFEKEMEIYRVKLPGPLKLIGEGKPENLNHAVIFTRGDVVQMADMKHDNYFEEALKMRSLLEEYSHDIRKKTTMFDRLWFLTRGGICKT